MKKFLQKLGWYLTFLFMGAAIAFYIAAKYIGFDSTKVDVIIKKLKNKRSAGDQSVTVPVTVEGSGQEDKESKKKSRRKDRKTKKNS